MPVTAFSQYKVYEYVNSGTPALATYTGMTFIQDGTNFLDALNTSSPSVVSMPANYIATCDSNYRYNVSQMTAYSNIGANFPSNGSYEFENQTTKFVLKIKDLRGNIAYSKDLEIDMNTTYFGFFMNSNGIGGVIIYRINDANCDVVIKGNSTFDNMYKTVYTIDGRDPLPDLEGGGAGSGYIGNSLVSNKKMVGYNAPTSSAESTKTESVNVASNIPTANAPKIGNGFARIKFLRDVSDHLFGFHINGAEHDPFEKVTYLEGAIGRQPAHMDFTNNTFDYGGWRNAFFMPRPCILNQNGTVQAYLNPDDYTKDVDGNDVNIGSTLSGANVMVEFPKIWMKVVPDDGDDSSGSVYIADTKLDDDFFDYAYISSSRVHKNNFYMAAYTGSGINNVLRSVSGVHPLPDSSSWTGYKEVINAKSNGTGWYIETIAQVMLINALLLLMGKSTNTQAVYGNGIITGGDSATNNYTTGTHNIKGLFYGKDTNTDAVKVFGIENWWGCTWRRYAGDISNKGTRKIKMCWGMEDGSSVPNFSDEGYDSGYVNIGSLSGTNGKVITGLKFISKKGFFAQVASGDDKNSDYGGRLYWATSRTDYYAMHGGSTSYDSGALGVMLQYYQNFYWNQFGACLSFI